MSKLYRVRPANKKTIEEIENNYLWFSRPTQFNDVLDANIFAFVKANESIGTAFARLFKNNVDVAEQSALAGICCFTEKLPSPSRLARFPNARNGLVLEYNREVLEDYFTQKKGLGDCFKKVEYLKTPTLFKSTNNYDILWEKIGDNERYRTINEISLDLKAMDQLFLKMFTRISSQYKKQKEHRIILAGANIPDKNKDLRGYQITIPKEAISKIHIHSNAPVAIKTAIEKSGYEYSIVENVDAINNKNKT